MMRTKLSTRKCCMSVLSLLALVVTCSATPSWAKEKSASKIAHELSNPNNSLGSLSFNLDYITYDGDLPDANDQDAWQFSFQPILPYHLAEDTLKDLLL